MKRFDWALLAIAIVSAALVYVLIGRPGYGDQPMSARAAEIAAKDPADMTFQEALARLELLIREQPDDPEPHYFIARLMLQQARYEDAIRAFQSALRRDPAHVPSLVGLGDTLVSQSGGGVPVEAASIYTEALRLDPTQVRAGFLIGVSAWQSGNREAADAHWRAYRQALNGTPDAANQLDGFVNAFLAREEAN